MKIVQGLFYTKSHEWIRVEDEEAFVGLTDYAQHELGDIVFVDMPEPGETFEAGDAFGAIESVKAASDIYIPVGGEILEGNSALEDSPELINEDPYENWIIKMKIGDEKDLDALMNASKYEAYLEEVE
ncbi:MAG: glycine cleavage system protein GcvH [Tissierellales bacterium]|jgi:glycine cleavage system H protein|nr:glycine cleavage system protein GcvH [Tissierellales bacterium]MBN2826389.1 glycine cleavage system protein GcvH [Tissierellales bacterium]